MCCCIHNWQKNYFPPCHLGKSLGRFNWEESVWQTLYALANTLMARNGCNCYFSFWTIFRPFTPLTAQKIKISKKKIEKSLKMSSFYKSVPKIIIIWYTVPEILHMTDVIVIFNFLDYFLLFTPPPNLPKKWKFQQNEKNNLHIPSFYKSVPKIMILCYTVPEIWHVADVIVIFYFGLFFALFPSNSLKNENFKKMNKMPGDVIILHKCTKNYDHTVYCSWDIAHDRCNCYFVSWAIFCPFSPLSCLKNENFKKMKKTSGDIIILQKCTKNHDHMLYCSWDMTCDRCNYFSFWAIFCPFTPLKVKKLKISKKWKKNKQEISSFYTSIQKITIIWSNGSWDIKQDRQNFLWFWAIFWPFTTTPLTTRKIKILKKWKKFLEILSFYASVPRIMIICYTAPKI